MGRRRGHLIVVLCLLLICGCQTITSDQVVFEPAKLELPLERLEGTWVGPGYTLVVRREAADRFVLASNDHEEEITLLPEGGLRVDYSPEEGEPQTSMFIDLLKVEGGYLMVPVDAVDELRGRDLSQLMFVRFAIHDERAEIEWKVLNGQALYTRLEAQPELLTHEKSRKRADSEPGLRPTIRLKDDPAKIRRFFLDHLNDDNLFVQVDRPVVLRKLGSLPPASNATTRRG